MGPWVSIGLRGLRGFFLWLFCASFGLAGPVFSFGTEGLEGYLSKVVGFGVEGLGLTVWGPGVLSREGSGGCRCEVARGKMLGRLKPLKPPPQGSNITLPVSRHA